MPPRGALRRLPLGLYRVAFWASELEVHRAEINGPLIIWKMRDLPERNLMLQFPTVDPGYAAELTDINIGRIEPVEPAGTPLKRIVGIHQLKTRPMAFDCTAIWAPQPVAGQYVGSLVFRSGMQEKRLQTFRFALVLAVVPTAPRIRRPIGLQDRFAAPATAAAMARPGKLARMGCLPSLLGLCLLTLSVQALAALDASRSPTDAIGVSLAPVGLLGGPSAFLGVLRRDMAVSGQRVPSKASGPCHSVAWAQRRRRARTRRRLNP